MPGISDHAKKRSKERVEGVETNYDARRFAKQAWNNGNHINKYARYPRFFSYLQNKKNQTRTTHVRIFKDNIYIWRGKLQTLVTVHPIPDRYKIEMRAVDNAQN